MADLVEYIRGTRDWKTDPEITARQYEYMFERDAKIAENVVAWERILGAEKVGE